MSRSVIWVSQLIVNYLGAKQTQNYLNKFNYGNQSLNGDINNFWLTGGSIKVSAKEQVRFLSNLWSGKFSIHRKTLQLTKDATYIHTIKTNKFYGKTGTGCLDKGCTSKLGRELGCFVGIYEGKGQSFAFALNFSEKKSLNGYAGLAAKDTVQRYFEKFNL